MKFPHKAKSGYRPVVSPATAALRLIEFGTINLSRGRVLDLRLEGKEAVITLLKGHSSLEVDGRRFFLGPRKNIFDDFPWALYVRGIAALKVKALSTVDAVASMAAVSARNSLIQVIEPPDVVEKIVGADTYERRVRTIIGEDFPAEKLLVGETINGAGKWSSYPPHRHEKDSLPDEVKLEEVYYYKLEKPNGFGVQRIYTDDGRIDEAHTVRDGDLCVLPRGYHPVASAPSSRLYYFWALAGKNRKMRVRVDPDFE
ncbi:MAG: 5-deoxy-glucuronate isomerase [Candidatus Lindowbacteria bacterium]|nr:5-deoxy-glucuronate isomerase [Candidatus Lindowbacteria bacterium]